jgi:hypothetical protein
MATGLSFRIDTVSFAGIFLFHLREENKRCLEMLLQEPEVIYLTETICCVILD